MNLIGESLEPFLFKDENLEPGELMEEGWFFGNLLDRKKRMLRSYSDPCTSLNTTFSEKSYEETYKSIEKLSVGMELDQPSLMRTPSMPEKGSVHRTKKSNGQGKRVDLLRAPSLPTCSGEEEFQDEESDFSMGKLIRQASLNHSDRKTPTKPASKSLTKKSSITRHSSQRKPDIETIDMEGYSEMKQKHLIYQAMKMQKSNDRRGFRDSRLSYNKRDSNPNVLKTLEEYEYFSETWHGESSAPPIPKWVDKRSNKDMKAQIKFWARAVASNVRAEC
ncbi:Hypothetical predicted protein [Olea europaea subsp. europaea]|uniref:Uncharacterized protein n=1 Tax=Olea europaea subsp. europaea TaxID=158383 RepID=A0A8S0PEX8_OLEEU|nr:Hypothetical predicted protein [Olea europaea subsp. europaea]